MDLKLCLLLGELIVLLVHPAHIAFTLINEDGVPEPSVGAIPSAGGTPLFVSVISRVGGDPVSFILASRR